MADIPYVPDERIVVTERELGGWSVRESAGTLRAEGPCPACRHNVGQDILPDVVSDVSGLRPDNYPPEKRTTRRFACNCNGTHKGRPESVKGGCGRWWLASLVVDPNGARVLIPSADDAIVGPAVALDAVAADELTAVRAWGEKWMPAVAAIYGLFSVAGLVVAKDTVASLPLPGRILAAALVVLAGIATLIAVLEGYRAAFGWLKVKDVSNDAKLAEWYRQRRKGVTDAPRQMGRALFAALVSFLLLTGAVGVLWFWPTDPPTPLLAIAYNQDSDAAKANTACGPVKDSKGGMIAVETTVGSTKEVTQINTGWVTAITVKDKC